MEQIRNQAQSSIPNLFDQDFNEEPPLKIGTEVFDCTMPSELEFQEEETHAQRHISKGEFCLFDVKPEEVKEGDGAVPADQPSQSAKQATATKESQYQMLTRSIVTFTFHKTSSSLTIFGQPEYALNSYIPHFLNVKTFPVRYRDDSDELNRGASALRLLWKSVVGYVKVEVFISAGTIYLLERKKEGLLVKATWSIAQLFKLFSDREEQKARLIFRSTQNGETKLITRELQDVDLNMLATLVAEAGTYLEIAST